MRILLLTTYFKPDITANGILLTQLALEWQRLGHEVTVVTSMPHYATNRIWDAYRGKLWVREKMAGLDVYRVYLYVPERKTSIFGRLFNYASFNLLSTAIAVTRSRPDIVFVPSPPLTNGVAGYIIAKRFGVPFIYNVQDIYPDIAIRLGILKNPRLIALFQRMERFVYRKARTVSVISQGFRRNLLAKGVPEEKIAVIPNFVDTDFIHPLPRQNAFSRQHGLDERFVVLFAGNVGLSQSLDTVLDAAARLRDQTDILFFIIGNGAAKPALQQRAREENLTNVRFLPFQPHEVVAEMYASADVGLVPLKKGITQESVPSKVFSIMAASRPIIAMVDEGSDTQRLIDQAQCGLCIEPENPDRLVEAILMLHQDHALVGTMGSRGNTFVQMYFSKSGVARQYIELFHQVTSNNAV